LRALHVEDDRLSPPRAGEHVTRVEDQEIVTPDHPSVPVHHPDPIAIAVERDTEVMPAAHDFGAEGGQVLDDGWIGMVVRKRTVAFAEEASCVGEQLLEQRRCDERCRSVAAVDDDARRVVETAE
jgi:hypothetical protein